MVTLDDVINPTAAGSYTLDVSTSSDSTPVTSPSYTVTAPQGVTGVTVGVPTPSTAAGATTDYTVGFQVSSTGGMTPAASSTVTLSMPSTTVEEYGTVYDGTTEVGYCEPSSSGTVTCPMVYGPVNAGDTLVVTLDDVINPTTAGSYTLDVSTSSDSTPVTSPSYTVTAPQGVTGVTVGVPTPSTAAGATTDYTVGFQVSSTGGMTPAASSTVTLSMPSTTGLGSESGTVYDGTTEVGYCYASSSSVATCPIDENPVNAGDSLVVTLDDVINPTAAGSYTLDVSTSSDSTPVTSPSYTVTAPQAVTGVTVSIAPPSTAAGATTTYTVGFQVSSTGGMTPAASSTITLSLPSTNVEEYGTVYDGTTEVGYCEPSSSGTVTCPMVYGPVNAGDSLVVTLDDVINPAAAGSYTLAVSTSSDSTPVTSPSYTVTAPQPVSHVTVSEGPYPSAGATTTYTVGFKVSSTGGMTPAASSTITLSLPSTNVEEYGTVYDGTTEVGYCDPSSSGTVTCPMVYAPVNAGDSLVVTLDDVINPTAAGSYTLAVSTSSDSTPVTSPSYTVTAAVPVVVSSVSPSTGYTTGGTPVTITGTGFTGTTEVDFDGVAASGVDVQSNTSLTAMSPSASAAGVVDVTVKAPVGTSLPNPADQFTYTVLATPVTVGCDPNCAPAVSTPLDATSVLVTGASTSTTASVSLVVNTGTLSCGSAYNYSAPITDLAATGFANAANLTVTQTIGGLPSVSGVKVCFQKKGATTTSFLPDCGSPKVAPCLLSLSETSGKVTARFLTPAEDPKWRVGAAAVTVTSVVPLSGARGSHVTLTGTNLNEVTAVLIGGGKATIMSATPTELVAIVPQNAQSGPIALTANSGSVVKGTFTVTEASPPGAPTGVKAASGSTTAVSGSLAVTFAAPVSSGGTPITGYTATCTSSNGGVTETGSHSGASAAPITVTGVATGKTYTCTVKATNAVGTGIMSAPSLPVIVGSPAAPSGITASHVASGQIKVGFTPGASNGATTSSYTARCASTNGGVGGAKSGPSSPLTVTGLTVGKTYTCTVSATNARGMSLTSVPSGVVTA